MLIIVSELTPAGVVPYSERLPLFLHADSLYLFVCDIVRQRLQDAEQRPEHREQPFRGDLLGCGVFFSVFHRGYRHAVGTI